MLIPPARCAAPFAVSNLYWNAATGCYNWPEGWPPEAPPEAATTTRAEEADTPSVEHFRALMNGAQR